jgi:type VII secretion protein EccE
VAATGATVRPATSRLRTSRMRRSTGLPGTAQLVTLELAAGGVAVAALAAPVPVLAAVSLVALLLVLIVVGRADGRWIYEWVAARWRLRTRRGLATRARARLGAADPRTLALATLAPRLKIRAVTDRGRTIGVGQDDRGWFAGVALGTWSDASGQRAVRLELDRLVRLLDESVMAVSALQVVTYSTLAPTGFVDSGSAAARSYRELASPDGCPLEQAVWLAVRLTPADAVEAAATRGGGVEGVDRAVAATVGRVEKILTSNGVPYEVLDADGLRDAIAFSCGLEAVDATGQDGRIVVRERWANWSAGGLTHVAFSISNWPREPQPDLVNQLCALPAFAVGLAIVLRPHGERVGLLGIVRVAAPRDQLRAALRQLDANARRLGLRLRRLDGEQGPGVLATAPTGAGGVA